MNKRDKILIFKLIVGVIYGIVKIITCVFSSGNKNNSYKEHSKKPNSINYTKRPPTEDDLITNVENGRFSKVQEILMAGINPNIDDYGRTPLLIAIAGNHVKIVEILLQYGASPDDEALEEFYFSESSPEIIEHLVNAGLDVNSKYDDSSLLNYALDNEHYDLFKIFT